MRRIEDNKLINLKRLLIAGSHLDKLIEALGEYAILDIGDQEIENVVADYRNGADLQTTDQEKMRPVLDSIFGSYLFILKEYTEEQN